MKKPFFFKKTLHTKKDQKIEGTPKPFRNTQYTIHKIIDDTRTYGYMLCAEKISGDRQAGVPEKMYFAYKKQKKVNDKIGKMEK